MAKSGELSANKASLDVCMSELRVERMEQIFNNIKQKAHHHHHGDGYHMTLKDKLKQRKLLLIDESFDPYRKLLLALFDYYLIEHATMNSAMINLLQNKLYKSFCMHITVFM